MTSRPSERALWWISNFNHPIPNSLSYRSNQRSASVSISSLSYSPSYSFFEGNEFSLVSTVPYFVGWKRMEEALLAWELAWRSVTITGLAGLQATSNICVGLYAVTRCAYKRFRVSAGRGEVKYLRGIYACAVKEMLLTFFRCYPTSNESPYR